MSREVARLLLQDIHFEIDEAGNGAEALRLARANDYDLILMDMRMPIMDGLEATRWIGATPPRPPCRSWP